MTDKERQRRLHVENRLEELRAKYGHEDAWLAAMDADRQRRGLDQPAGASHAVTVQLVAAVEPSPVVIQLERPVLNVDDLAV